MESSRILVVDDEPGYAKLIGDRFDRAEGVSVVTTMTEPDAVLEYLKAGTSDVDCIVSDYDMPTTNGLELLDAVREVAPAVDFVLYTAHLDDDLVAEAEAADVAACFQKDGGRRQFKRLLDTVRAAAATGEDAEESEAD